MGFCMFGSKWPCGLSFLIENPYVQPCGNSAVAVSSVMALGCGRGRDSDSPFHDATSRCGLYVHGKYRYYCAIYIKINVRYSSVLIYVDRISHIFIDTIFDLSYYSYITINYSFRILSSLYYRFYLIYRVRE